MIYIYFNDKNGTIYSADKQRCFSVVFGDDVYAFLRSEKNKEKRFYRTQTEETGGDMVLIEVPPEKVRAVRKEERRKQYVSDCMKNKEFTILHLGNMDSDDGITGEELIASLDESVDTLAIRNLDISTLRKALKTLNEKEYEVIASLHYASPPLTEAQLGGLESAYLLCPFLAKKSTPFPMCSSVDSSDCCFVTNLMTLANLLREFLDLHFQLPHLGFYDTTTQVLTILLEELIIKTNKTVRQSNCKITLSHFALLYKLFFCSVLLVLHDRNLSTQFILNPML